MAARTTHVRLNVETKRQLDALAILWAEGGLQTDWAPAEGGMHVSIDAVIGELIRRDAEHRLRAFRQRSRRRRAFRAGGAAAGEENGQLADAGNEAKGIRGERKPTV